MTDFLKLDALTVEVSTDGAERNNRELLGEVERAWDGTLRSTVAGYKDTWRCTLRPMTNAEADAVEAAIGLGMIPVSGTFFGGLAEFDAFVQVMSRRAVPDLSQTSLAQWIMQLEIKQV